MAYTRELAQEEILLVPIYRQYWEKIAFSTVKLDHQKVENNFQALYSFLNLDKPRIHYCCSPYNLVHEIKDFISELYFCEDGSVFPSLVMGKLHEIYMDLQESIGHWDMALTSQFRAAGQAIDLSVSRFLLQAILNNLPIHCREVFTYWVFPRFWYADEASFFDFHFSVVPHTLFREYDAAAWRIYSQLIQTSSWFTAFESDCFICERPTEFIFSSNDSFPESAMFADGNPINLSERDLWDFEEY